MLKRGRAVVLDKKVRGPRQRIRKEKGSCDPPPPLQQNRGGQQNPPCKSTHQMERSSPRLAVRADIFGPEICEIRYAAHAAESSTRGFQNIFGRLFPIPSSEGELAARAFLRIPISKAAKPSRSIEF